MADDPCIGMAIWQDALQRHPELRTAQQRYAFDRYLRERLHEIEERGLRHHAAEILRQQRIALLNWRQPPDQEARLRSIEQRLTNIEAALSGHRTGQEITSIRPDKSEEPNA